MRRQAGMGAVAIVLLATTAAVSGEHIAHEPPRPHLLQRLHPSGGWNPGGGLFHWWAPYCLPQACGPNDYCRKPFPNLCRYPIAPACAVPGPPQTPVPAPGPNVSR